MENKLKGILSILMVTLILSIASINVFAATIGLSLASPESGWRRYDANLSTVNCSGTYSLVSFSGYYDSNFLRVGAKTTDSYVTFKFYGTKLRILGYLGNHEHSSDTQVVIDGNEAGSFSQVGSGDYECCLNFEATDLSLGEHVVRINVLASTTNGFLFDAFDIDDTGYIIDYNTPINLQASAGNETVNLTWDSVEDATGYNIKRSTTSGGPYSTIASNLTSTTFTDSSVDNDITYYYVVSALVDTEESYNSMEVSATPQINKPSQPTNLIAVAGNGQVELSWDTVTTAVYYNIKRSTQSGGTYETVATSVYNSYTDKYVTNGITYYYVVSAINAGGESINSDEASATPINIVTKKLKLVLEVNELKQLSVTDDLSDNADMSWTSSDTSIASVDANGKIKALKPGNTVITSTSEDGTYTESINVLVVDLSYQLAVDLTVGDTCRLTVDDLTNTTKVSWTTYDTSIATVSSKGKATAVSEGLTYVTAADEQGNEIGRIYIRVRK